MFGRFLALATVGLLAVPAGAQEATAVGTIERTVAAFGDICEAHAADPAAQVEAVKTSQLGFTSSAGLPDRETYEAFPLQVSFKTVENVRLCFMVSAVPVDTVPAAAIEDVEQTFGLAASSRQAVSDRHVAWERKQNGRDQRIEFRLSPETDGMVTATLGLFARMKP